MNSFAKLTSVEIKLLLREPAAVFFGVAFAPILVVVLGSIPGFRKPVADLGGARVIDLYVPVCAAFVLAILGVAVVPTALAIYRERGVLRRMSTTPVPPARLLGANLLAGLAMGLVAIVALLAVGRIAFGVALPRQLLGYALALVLAAAAVFALGLVVAAVAPSGKASSVIGNLLFFPLMFFAGLYVPREAMPHGLRQVSDYTPLGAGVQALRDASTGSWPHATHLAVLAGYLAVFSLAAARLFRWE
ncbi:MAG: type transport system permease protein [Micromonosporaceae bacterium]